MAFSASLARFRGLVSQAISQASPTGPGTGESFPVSGSKDDVARHFQGAIFKLKEAEGYAFASAPVARLTGGTVELVFSGTYFNSARKYRKSDWLDQHVEEVAFSVMNGSDWHRGAAPTTFAVPRDGDETAIFDKLTVTSGGNLPYQLPIDEVMSMGFTSINSDGSTSKLQWQPWKPRVAPAAPPAPPPLVGFAAADLGAVNAAPRVILKALGVRPDADDDTLCPTTLGHLIATLGGLARGSLAVAQALQPGDGYEDFIAELTQAFGELHDVDPGLLADAAIEAREAVADTHASVPTPRHAILGDALRRALQAVAVAPKTDIDADADGADEADSAAATTAHPTSSDPAVNAYIAQLEASLARRPPPPAGEVTRPTSSPPPRSTALALTSSTSASAALRLGRAGLAAASPPPLPSQPPLDDNISEALAAFFPTEAAGMPLERAVAQAGGLPLRTELARLNGARPLQDGLLGADSFDSALEAMHDICTIEADLHAKGAVWKRPPQPPTFNAVKGLIGALARAVHAARHMAPARAATPDEAHPGGPAARAGGPPPPPDGSPFAAGGLPVYGASSKLAYAATSTTGVDAAVIAPLLTRAALAAEFTATPLPDVIPEARRLCAAFGNPAIAYHLSSGTADAPTSGEHLPLSLHSSRAAVWRLTQHLVSAAAADPDAASVRPLAIAISSLTGIKCADFTPLLGGHAVTKVRGKSAPKPGTAGACAYGTLVGDGARFSLLQAVSALATIICDTIGIYAAQPAADAKRLCGIPKLAEELVVGAGVAGAVTGLDDFFEQLAGEVALLRTGTDAANIDIADLVKAFTTESLPGHVEDRRFDEKFAARRPVAPAPPAPPPTNAPTLKPKLATTPPAGLQAPALPGALPPAIVAPGQRQADPNSKRSLKAAAKLTGGPPAKLPRATPAAGATPGVDPIAAAAAAFRQQQTLIAQQFAAQNPWPPAPPPPPPAPLAPPAAPLQASAGVGAQWPCALTFLFGACTATSAGKPCRRCADPRPAAAVPAGTRTAIKAACLDLVTQAKILAGG